MFIASGVVLAPEEQHVYSINPLEGLRSSGAPLSRAITHMSLLWSETVSVVKAINMLLLQSKTFYH